MDVALAVHELRTPLTAAKGFVDTVLLQWDKLDDERRQDLLARAVTNMGVLTSMIDQMLLLSRTSDAPIQLEEIDLAAFVDATVEEIAPLLETHQVLIQLERVNVLAEKWALESIISNLLINASKYTPDGTDIHIGSTVNNGVVTVSVQDQGPGIPVDQQQKVFEPFQRLSTETKGSGLGLSVVKELVERQGGTIELESELGHGATFRFTLNANGRK